ncbi:NACHT, LRR and PYD domains-containing protein 3-like [Dysidea avara]|uniref:NACHT, LRR and PYD domains-containing protein 3-like n=1 Tax=Dysidea avara TaxID=196820 RepID=UPI0033201B04
MDISQTEQESDGNGDNQPTITLDIIQRCSPVICQHMDPVSLAPYIQQDFLLTAHEMHQFASPNQSPGYKAIYLIQQLQTKHPSSAHKFYNCLLKAKEHSGHTHIAEVLREAALNNDPHSIQQLVTECTGISPFQMPATSTHEPVEQHTQPVSPVQIPPPKKPFLEKDYAHYTGISTYHVAVTSKLHSVEEYRKYLVILYQKIFPAAEKRPYFLPNHFVNLALVTEDECRFGKDTFTDYSIRGSIDDILRMKQSIHYREIFKSEVDKEIDFVVMEGRPGVGKTTLAQKLCREWAEGTNEMFKKYKLVVMVQLRDFSTKDVPTLDDIFYHEGPELKSDVVSQIAKTNGENVLLILEGWDELPLHLREFVKVKRTGASIFIKLVERISLTQATILVTSRHVATKDFHGRLQNRVSRFVEVLGLTSSDIRDYVRQYLQDEAKSSDLIGQLQDRPHIESMCYIPLNCRIVCELFATQKGELPSTITEIYSQLIKSFLQRYFDVDAFISYDDIPKMARPTFYAVCKLAYEGIVNHKLVFSQHEIQDIVGTEFSETFDGFGLFQAVSSFHVYGSTKSFHFNHLTFQEYLAAYHISDIMGQNEQLKLVTEHANSEHLNNVWKFYAGVSKLDNFPIAQVLCSFDMNDPLDKAKLVCHCAYESQNAEVCNLIADRVDSATPQFFSVSAYDCLALSFVIGNSTDREWSVELRSCGMESSHLRMLAKHIKGLQQESLALCRLDLSGNQVGSKGIKYFTECVHAISFIRSLSIRQAFIDTEGIEALSKLVESCPNILSINLDNNKLTNGSSRKLIEVLQSTDTTEFLSISSNNLGIEDASIIGSFLEKTECLKELKLNDNHLESSCIPNLYLGLCDNKSLQCLYLEENDINESGFLILLKTLATSNIKSLYLRKNHIYLQNKNIPRLKEDLLKIHSLHKLDLSFCKMGESVCCLIESLGDNRSLKILNFQDNELTDNNIVLICKSLVSSTVQRMIDIRPNTITDFSCVTKLTDTRNADNWICFTISSHRLIERNILQLKEAVSKNPNLGKVKVIYLKQSISTVPYPENILEDLSLNYCFVRITKLKMLNLEKIKQSGLDFVSCKIQELPDTLKTSNIDFKDVVVLIECKL